MSGEASVVASPGGDFFYALWNQETLDRRGNVIASDAWFRRVMYLDDESTDDTDDDTGDDTDDGTDDDPSVPPGGGNNR